MFYPRIYLSHSSLDKSDTLLRYEMSVFTKGKTALITGSASGVGLATANLCRKYGMNLALVDNNKSLLAQAKEKLSATGSITESYEMDVSKIEQWEDLREKVNKQFNGVDLLMLNAGIGLKSGWSDQEYFHKVFIAAWIMEVLANKDHLRSWT